MGKEISRIAFVFSGGLSRGAIQSAFVKQVLDKVTLDTFAAYQFGIIVHVVHSGKFVEIHSKDFAVAIQGENVCVGVDAGLVHTVEVQD